MDTNLKGLTSQEVSRRVAEGKINITSNLKTKSIGRIFRDNICTLFNAINVVLLAALAFVGSYKNMLFIGIMIANTTIGIVQEIRSKKSVDKLTILSEKKVTVVRDGRECEISRDEIVQDDVVALSRGSQIPADCIVCEGECKVNESLLTGESDLIEKKVGDELLSGSFISLGKCYAKANKVGAESYAAKINDEAKYIKKVNSEILRSFNFIIKICTFILFPVGIAFFIRQFGINDGDLQATVVSTVAALLGMIPKGMILLTSSVLAVSIIRLTRQKVLVQEMYCIETLARVDVLCLDKTGTLTTDEMNVTDVITMCNKEEIGTALASIAKYSDDKNATLLAIEKYAKGQKHIGCKKFYPFSSETKWSGGDFDNGKSYVMGAAEFIFKDKNKYKEVFDTIESINDTVRIIVLASSEKSLGNGLPDDITPLAVVLIKDKLRENVNDTINYFKEQGVALKVISGDSVKTVQNIAKDTGITGAENAIDMTTVKTQEELEKAAENCSVFGRVTPQQKKQLVIALKKNGHSVAMTGDGVNDVLALKESDCSIAMQSGSDAARNVSNIVLLDSNFASMPKIVGEGRRSINNIERSSVLFLYKTVYSFLAALMFCFVPMGYPLQAIQLTQINMFTNGIPSFLLAMEPNFKRVKGEFIENVLPRSIMHGLLITFNFVGIVLMRYISGWMDIIPRETFDYSIETMSTICIGFAAFVILFKVCMPFKPWKIGLFIFLIGGFTADIFILRDFLLDLKPMCFEMIVMTGILMGATVLIEALSSFFERHITDNLLVFQRYWKDVFVKMSAKRKAGKENKNA